jgi:transcriptional regulator with XRE-family HTH domain
MDTQKITSDLLKSGLTQQELADLVPCGQSTIAAYLAGTRGSRPSKFIGDRLEELHAERCAGAIGDPPKRRATDPKDATVDRPSS